MNSETQHQEQTDDKRKQAIEEDWKRFAAAALTGAMPYYCKTDIKLACEAACEAADEMMDKLITTRQLIDEGVYEKEECSKGVDLN